jgi:hypothetical protein
MSLNPLWGPRRPIHRSRPPFAYWEGSPPRALVHLEKVTNFKPLLDKMHQMQQATDIYLHCWQNQINLFLSYEAVSIDRLEVIGSRLLTHLRAMAIEANPIDLKQAQLFEAAATNPVPFRLDQKAANFARSYVKALPWQWLPAEAPEGGSEIGADHLFLRLRLTPLEHRSFSKHLAEKTTKDAALNYFDPVQGAASTFYQQQGSIVIGALGEGALPFKINGSYLTAATNRERLDAHLMLLGQRLGNMTIFKRHISPLYLLPHNQAQGRDHWADSFHLDRFLVSLGQGSVGRLPHIDHYFNTWKKGLYRKKARPAYRGRLNQR